MALGVAQTRLVGAALVTLLALSVYWLGWQAWGGYQLRAAQSALENRDFEAAAGRLDRVLEAWPDDPDVRLLAARTARRRGRSEDVSSHLRFCSRHPEFAQRVALEYQLLRVQEGEVGDGAAIVSLALEEPELPEAPLMLEALVVGCLKVLVAWGALGLTRAEVAARPELAWGRDAAEAWLRTRPGDADQVQGLVWRGRLHEIAGEHATAVADLRRAVEQAPEEFQPRWFLAAAIGQSAPEEAADHYARLLERQPENRQVRLLLALGRRGSGRFDEARKLLEELLALSPNDVPLLLERGRLALDEDQAAAALEWLRRAEGVAPNSPEVNLALGRTLHRLGQASEAQQYQARFEQLEAQEAARRAEQLAKIKGPRAP